jgi:A/G-specific adenine glycosylase
VLDYYAKFLQHFPTVADLAAASQDQVMGLWSGLGYYSRARNLHQCAKDVMTKFGGAFPRTAQELMSLPGIGRSTAAAVASFCFSERVAIMDGNVKRVLTRVWAYDSDLSISKNEKVLWQMAEDVLPTKQIQTAMPRYSQALMDLGATICLPRKPLCKACPVRAECQAHGLGEPEKFPVKTRKLKRTSEVLWLLLAQNQKGQVWLEKRPESGIWASLYSVPVFASEKALFEAVFGSASPQSPKHLWETLPTFKHVLTHKDLHCHVIKVMLRKSPIASPSANENASGAWWSKEDWQVLGLPTPVRHLLSNSL